MVLVLLTISRFNKWIVIQFNSWEFSERTFAEVWADLRKWTLGSEISNFWPLDDISTPTPKMAKDQMVLLQARYELEPWKRCWLIEVVVTGRGIQPLPEQQPCKWTDEKEIYWLLFPLDLQFLFGSAHWPTSTGIQRKLNNAVWLLWVPQGLQRGEKDEKWMWVVE